MTPGVYGSNGEAIMAGSFDADVVVVGSGFGGAVTACRLAEHGARVLVLDPEGHPGAGPLARELGATHVVSGFVPPPEVARLIDRWITLASSPAASEGWSRRLATDSPPDAESWIEAAGQGPAPAIAVISLGEYW